MTAELSIHQLVSVEDYLAAEENADERHEYLAGIVYGMAGATNAHNAIAANVPISLGIQLKGKSCQPFNPDTKVRIRLADQTRFYYPDAQVVCRQNPLTDHFQDEPAVVFEVVSESTRRVDEVEKKAAYLAIPSLLAYVLLEQDSPKATVWRRGEFGFVGEIYTGREAVIPLPEVGAELSLDEVYSGI